MVKSPFASAGDLGNTGLLSGSGRSPGGRNGNPLHYSCLEKSRGQRSLEGYSPWGHKEPDRALVSTFLSTFAVPVAVVMGIGSILPGWGA